MRIFILLIISINILTANAYIDNITFQKIKKLVQKEELIAKAYKNYIYKYGKTPTNMKDLKDKSEILPAGFTTLNYFNKPITLTNIKNTKIEVKLNSDLPKVLKEKINVYEYYYSNKNRVYTIAPITSHNKSIKIKLSEEDKYIIEFQDQITTDKTEARNKYYLDEHGVLHWYDNSNNYKFSYGKNLILDSSVNIFDEITGLYDSSFKSLFQSKKVLYTGLQIFHTKENKVLEYLNLGEKGKIIKVGETRRSLGETILKFTRRAGGMIVNGDIYTWGNNAKQVVGVGKNTYTTKNGEIGKGYPVINTLVKAKAVTYENDIDSKQYFSSPLRPKFIEFTSDVWHSTCGVSIKGELYCGGTDGNNNIEFEGKSSSSELLYRSKIFNGTDFKIKKVFSLLATYIALGKPANDNQSGYLIYYWGGNNKRGYGATGFNVEKNITTPTNVSNIRFKDLTYTLSVFYRRIAALTPTGDIYTWGLDDNITSLSCMQNTSLGNKNFCKPIKVNSDVNFVSLLGGQRGFLAKDDEGQFYRISQKKIGTNVGLAKVDKINDLIKNYSDYDLENDSEILSADLSSKLNSGGTLEYGEGIVWVNKKNELKGDYFTSDNKDDDFFKEAIKKIKWKIIRVVEDQNGMCGIDTNNQMYCWGDMTFFGGGNNAGNTFMLPMFTANLHDENKDFLMAEGGDTFEGSKNVTNMTSGDWEKGIKKEYFIKYPTYFGGFNYEFEFK